MMRYHRPRMRYEWSLVSEGWALDIQACDVAAITRFRDVIAVDRYADSGMSRHHPSRFRYSKKIDA
jgi:hypothetical protein